MTLDPNSRTKLATLIQQRWPTRARFCEEFGISQSHLSLVLSGKRGVSVKRAKLISEALNKEISVGTLCPELAEAMGAE